MWLNEKCKRERQMYLGDRSRLNEIRGECKSEIGVKNGKEKLIDWWDRNSQGFKQERPCAITPCISSVELLNSYFPRLNMPTEKIGEWGTDVKKSINWEGRQSKKLKKQYFLKSQPILDLLPWNFSWRHVAKSFSYMRLDRRYFY